MNKNCVLKVDDIVFVLKVEQYWDKPYTMKRHHVYQTRSVILKGRVTEIRGDEFKAYLFDNNFEKDNDIYVFQNKELLEKQELSDLSVLGQWKNIN